MPSVGFTAFYVAQAPPPVSLAPRLRRPYAAEGGWATFQCVI